MDDPNHSPLRILVVSAPPLCPDLGAAQVALNLARALSDLGHQATAFAPTSTSGKSRLLAARADLERHVAEEGPFDIVDVPPVYASSRLAGRARLVVRSIQPELLYLVADTLAELKTAQPALAVNLWLRTIAALRVLRGWSLAHRILCLGSNELRWMRRRFPWWASKLGSYSLAPSNADRQQLMQVRSPATPNRESPGTRFLWLGRWAHHKGIDRLIRFAERRLASSPHDSLTIAGCGAVARDALPSMLARCERFRMVETYSREMLPKLIGAHDAGLFTSHVEGWGLTLMEMLEGGLPVYAVNTGAVPDLQPFFPRQLRSFPPPAERLECSSDSRDDVEASGYLSRFSWPRIGRAYLQEVLRSPGDPSREDLRADRRATESRDATGHG